MADKPTISWDEGNPPGTQGKSLGAERMRELKIQLRELLSTDHVFESSGSGATWGYHEKCNFYVQSAAPTPEADTGCLYAKDVTNPVNTIAELHWVDEDYYDIQLTQYPGNFVGGMVGEVRIWKGALSYIPGGWALCDGTGGTPNLVGKFIRGVNTNATNPADAPTSSDNRTLAAGNIPAHTHTATTATQHLHAAPKLTSASAGAVTVLDNYPRGVGNSGSIYTKDFVVDGGAHTHTVANAGGGLPFDNRPAYREGAFIIKSAT